MVGIFSRFSGSRNSHRRTQSAVDEREVPPNADTTGVTTAAAVAAHGIEVAVEFKPVEHPVEPLDNDRPVKCPLPEPSILNDGRIWKEHISANAQRMSDLSVMKEESHLEPEVAGIKQQRSQSNRLILPSLSAPEHNLVHLLEECNASGN
ncbi:PREDICTED: uncharacterized protein LOC104611435 [Nelumbo nucifera]|uniref:Uncharacterized protein LOC104611435 n=2 Tax=Nelumbo nucifera TaxID=4432 RepID=A0A1U8BAM5_NELNU|nr:PREDICTED: uncharacterized protein LOC104611435 [Nelumbo nucifera]